jgi:hypothetical protein
VEARLHEAVVQVSLVLVSPLLVSSVLMSLDLVSLAPSLPELLGALATRLMMSMSKMLVLLVLLTMTLLVQEVSLLLGINQMALPDTAPL